jgi:ADP-heptose:LPS heptosyltransferase
MLRPTAFYHSARTLRRLRRVYFDLGIELRAGVEAGLVWQLARVQERLVAQSGASGRGVRYAIERIAESLAKRPPPFKHDAHRYLEILEPLGVRPVEAEPRLATNREADERIEKLLAKSGVQSGELLVGIHPGAGPGRQRWPVERFVSVATRLIYNFDARVLVFAGPYERGLARRIVALLPAKRALAIESPRLADFASALARLSVMVANHSGPAHVAAATGAPVVVASTYAGPSAQDLLSKHHAHIRRERAEAIPEEEVYEAACRLLKTSRAEILSAL